VAYPNFLGQGARRPFRAFSVVRLSAISVARLSQWTTRLLGFVVLGLSCTRLLALTEGVINTRPSCFPAQPAPVPLEGNYIQGPDPVRLDNGDVAIVVDGGYGQGEALLTLLYPTAGSIPPRWYPIYATNNWTGDPYYRNEWEAAFPSVIYWQGSWRVMYTATYNYFLRNESENYNRVGRIDAPSLTSQPSAVLLEPWSWIRPLNTECHALGSCTKSGTGSARATTISGKLNLYLRDGNYAEQNPGCNLVRYKIKADANLTPTFDGCIAFDLTGLPPGRSQYPPGPNTGLGSNVYDVATGQDGKVYMLTAEAPYTYYVDEFVSTDGGRTFRFNRVVTTTPNGFNFVTETAYLTDKNGIIVEPRVIVGLVGSYTSYPPPVNGTWRLYYWASLGAVLPASWGTDAYSCPAPPVIPAGVPGYQGNFDGTSCQVASGWVWDWYQPNTPVNVDIYDNGTLLATVPANVYRPDLPTQGYFGNANHGFSYNLPAGINNSQAHTLSVKYAGTQLDTSNSPRTITCPEPSSFYTVTPCRVADTRNAPGPYGGPALSANTTRSFTIGDQCGIPADAKSVVFNVTVTGATSRGSLRLYPGGAVPLSSAINYNPGQTRANNAVIALGAGRLAVYCDQASGTANVIIDVSGYFK
jgi:hypothetical protein